MIRSTAAASVIAIAVFLSWRDLMSYAQHGAAADDVDGHMNKANVPEPKLMKSRTVGPTLRFLYCYSCGYRRAFDEYSRIIQERYPSLSIEGDNYPPPAYKSILAQTANIGKIAFIVAVLFSFNPFGPLGIETPALLQWAFDNKIYACMMTFFLCNMIEGQLVATGAFEIMLNDVPVWSKLENGRIPSPPEFLQILDSQLKMTPMGIPGAE